MPLNPVIQNQFDSIYSSLQAQEDTRDRSTRFFPDLYVKIMGHDSSTPPKHSWEEVKWNGIGWETLTGGATGTTSVQPAYEWFGMATASGTIVKLHPGNENEWIFQVATTSSLNYCSIEFAYACSNGSMQTKFLNIPQTLGITVTDTTTFYSC